MARRRFFVDEVRNGHAQIEGEDAHHLTRVLRVETGQKYEISDNRQVYLAEIEAARKDLVSFVILDRLEHDEPCVQLSLYAGLIRFERFEVLVEKATELGVGKIVPVQAERSEKGLDRAAGKRMVRWQRIAREASEQARRATLPDIAGVLRISDALQIAPGFRFVLDEHPGAEPILRAIPALRSSDEEISILVGPEGGWTDRERAGMRENNWRAVSLGRSILKTETAAIAALGIVNAVWQGRS